MLLYVIPLLHSTLGSVERLRPVTVFIAALVAELEDKAFPEALTA